MKELLVNSQAELDALSTDYEGRIIITYKNAIVSNKYKYEVIAAENSSVEAQGESSIIALANSAVSASGQSFVVAKGNSFVRAKGRSSVVATDESVVISQNKSSTIAQDNSSVIAKDDSQVSVYDNAKVVALNNSFIYSCGNSQVLASGDAKVKVFDAGTVLAEENAIISLFDNSVAKAKGNSFVSSYDSSKLTNDTAPNIISKKPLTIEDYIQYHNLTVFDDKVLLYKVVRKSNGKYYSDHDKKFEYIIGQEAVADSLETDPDIVHGAGINMAHLTWCLLYGETWKDAAILEVEADIEGAIVLTVGGKIRTAKCKPIREIPLNECGIYGQIVAKLTHMDNIIDF